MLTTRSFIHTSRTYASGVSKSSGRSDGAATFHSNGTFSGARRMSSSSSTGPGPKPALIREIVDIAQLDSAAVTAPEPVKVLMDVANTYHSTGFYDEAIDTYQSILDQWEAPGPDGIALVHICVGLVFQSLAEDDSALEYFERAAKASKPGSYTRSSALACVAAVRFYAGDFAEAKLLLEDALATRAAVMRSIYEIDGVLERVHRQLEDVPSSPLSGSGLDRSSPALVVCNWFMKYVVANNDPAAALSSRGGPSIAQYLLLEQQQLSQIAAAAPADDAPKDPLVVRDWDLDKVEEAMAISVVDSRRRVWADVASLLHNIACCEMSMGNAKASIPIFLDEAVPALRFRLGADHPRTMLALRNADSARRLELKEFSFKPVEIKPIVLPKGMMTAGKAGGKSGGGKGGKKKGGKKKK